MLTFAIELKWAPVALWGSPIHAILPVLTLGLFFAGRIVRLMKEGTATALTNPYVRTAKAKGLSPVRFSIVTSYRHVLPVVSYSGPLLRASLDPLSKPFQNPRDRRLYGQRPIDYTLIVG